MMGPRERAEWIRDSLKHCETDRATVDAGVLYEIATALDAFAVLFAVANKPTPMRLECPACGDLHIDEGEFATKPHHTHACQSCGAVWRPAVVDTVGVRFLPGFKNGATP